MIVRMRHVRAAKLCSNGGRIFAARHGLDWSEFLSAGIDADILEATGDPLAMRAVEAARAENANGR